MNVVPFVHEGLGNSSYLVELGDGEAALLDPDRTAARYLQAAEARGWRIVSVFETHLHADFISGNREVAHATGARIFAPEGGKYRFSHQALKSGERVRLAGAEIESVASPGHTPEHLSYVVRREGSPPMLFSGGSLMVGGAARTDLVSPDLTDTLTKAQFRTVKEAFSSLPDETLLLPTHGGGSFCTAGGSGDRTSTLGQERASNPVLSFEDEGEFARWFLSAFPAVPAYFSRMRPANAQGPRLRHEIPQPPPLAPAEFAARAEDSLIVDVRPIKDYMEAHIPGSMHIAYRPEYATWLGWLVPDKTPLLFVTGDVPVEDVVDQSLLVGYEDFAGRLEGGIEAWVGAGNAVKQAKLVDVPRARGALLDGAASVDVREPSEYQAGHIEGAIAVPLGTLEANLDRLPRDRPLVAYCGHGERAASAVSILERAGFDPLLNLDGGFGAWKEAGHPVG